MEKSEPGISETHMNERAKEIRKPNVKAFNKTKVKYDEKNAKYGTNWLFFRQSEQTICRKYSMG